MGMKTVIFIVFLFPSLLSAQIDLPPASPDASWTHQLGFTQIDMSYSRPQMRGRKIFGSLVPYHVLWRTGAGESTRIKFSDDIKICGQSVMKGQYALYSIPGPDEWTIILNADATLHGDFGYDQKKDVLRVKVRPTISPKTQESFTVELTDFQADYSAVLRLSWENTIINIPVMTNADSRIMAQINDHLIQKSGGNAGLLNKGAQHYFSQKKDLNQALVWSQKSESIVSDNYNYTYLTTIILEDLKRYADAIHSAERALEIVRKKNMVEEAKHLEEKIAEWTHYLQTIKK
jgi:Protein of unknown function (DUF2911)